MVVTLIVDRKRYLLKDKIRETNQYSLYACSPFNELAYGLAHLCVKFSKVGGEAQLIASFNNRENLETRIEKNVASEEYDPYNYELSRSIGIYSSAIIEPYESPIYLNTMIDSGISVNLSSLIDTMFLSLSELQHVGLCHNDIREENILLDQRTGDFILVNFYRASALGSNVLVTKEMEQYLSVNRFCSPSFKCTYEDDLYAFACVLLHTINKNYNTYKFSQEKYSSRYKPLPCVVDVTEQVVTVDSDSGDWIDVEPVETVGGVGYYDIIEVNNRCIRELINYILNNRPSVSQAMLYYQDIKNSLLYRLTC